MCERFQRPEFILQFEQAVEVLLRQIGEDPCRDGLRDTPRRVRKAWVNELFKGYQMEPAEVLKFFEADYSEMVTLRDIEFYSTCEHHIMPFSGVAHVGYIPDKRVVGISKLARLVEIFSRRLQIQERLGDEIVNAIMDHIQPRGAGVILEARHMCMVCRGVQKQQSVMLTSHLKGNFLKRPSVKEEFQKLVLNGKCL